MSLLWQPTQESLQLFLTEHRLSEQDWESANFSWEEAVAIANDHIGQTLALAANASMYAGLIQSIENVHSVRWRVKNPKNLVAKIIRKKIEKKSTYENINSGNYYEIITDLVGIRALHLFKEDFREIHQQLVPLLADKETPVANIREGDSQAFLDSCEDLGLQLNKHAAGYRSIHYVKTVRPLNRDLHVEIQLRTVFEEGWSEVDHQVRYPNFSDDPLVAYASLILNRLSGMADEMSSYARQLAGELGKKTQAILGYQKQNDDALKRINDLVLALEQEKQSGEKKQEFIGGLKKELANLKEASNHERISLGHFRDAKTALSHFGDVENLNKTLRNFKEFDAARAASLLNDISLRQTTGGAGSKAAELIRRATEKNE